MCVKQFVSTAHASISPFENIEKAIDNKLFACGIFIDLQNVFATIDHKILPNKVSHCRIKDLGNC